MADRLVIVYRPIDDLVPYVRNARTHSPEQIELLKRLMLQFGWTNPVLLDGADGMLAGHGRIVAARALWTAGSAIKRCPTGMVPTIDLAGFTEAEKRAYVLADNQSALRAGWDMDLVRLELGELKSTGFDMSLTGFSTSELSRFTAGIGSGDSERTPDPPAAPTSVLGDVWRLGRHRIVCGDSTNAEAVAAALNGAVPHLMVTDPPYGVNYDPGWRAAAGVNRATGKLGVVANDNRADWREAWRLFPGRVMYVWHAGLFSSVVQASIEASGFTVRSQIVWAKDRFALGRGNYHWQHEPCWMAVRPHDIGAGGGYGERKQRPMVSRCRVVCLAARRGLVRGAQGQAWRVCRRPLAIDAVDHPGARRRWPRARNTKADRMHASADREQFRRRRRGL